MKYYKRLNMIFFAQNELHRVYSQTKMKHISEIIKKTGLDIPQIAKIPGKLEEIVDKAIEVGLKDKEEVEVFATLLYAPHFYGKESQIGFVLKDSVNPKNKVQSIEDLAKIVKENDLTDFGILTNEGIRLFQLKVIKFPPSAESIYGFLEEAITHYSKNLGGVNLLLSLQGVGELDTQMFVDLNEKLLKFQFVSQAEILIGYNEENKYFVMNQIYPKVTTSRVDIHIMTDIYKS